MVFRRIFHDYVNCEHHLPAKSLAAGTMVVTGYIGAYGGLTAGHLGISIGGGDLKYAVVPAAMGGVTGVASGSLSYVAWHHLRHHQQVLYTHIPLFKMPSPGRTCAIALAGVAVYDAAMYVKNGWSFGYLLAGCALYKKT